MIGVGEMRVVGRECQRGKAAIAFEGLESEEA